MKANPVYKCERCGEIIIHDDYEFSAEELECVDNVKTHICDINTYLEEGEYHSGAQIGIITLVGYNEVPERDTEELVNV